jgi:tripartite-type tricarboxylate transporter receptor subunit TctC
VLAPKGLPPALQARFNSEFATALDDGQVRQRLIGFGLGVPESRQNTVAALKKHIDDFKATYDKLIDELGIEAQ